MTHQHRPKTSVDRPYTRCVNPERCTTEAHGNITRVDTCSCGATREQNINQSYIERGTWRDGTT